ncbi:hypothetical protein [Aestuariivirga sp.]
MNEPFNFHDGWYVIQQNWVWILVALAIGLWVGWVTNRPDEESAKGDIA